MAAANSPATPGGRRPGTGAGAGFNGGNGLKQERAAHTRRTLLKSAAEAFAEKGFPAVTILDVAQMSGMTKGAVYFHFANKEVLATAVTEEFYRRLHDVVESVHRAGLPPLRTVAEIMTRTAVAFRDEPVVQAGARLQIERSLINAALPTPYVGFGDEITALLTRAREAGDLPSDSDPGVLSRVLVAAFFGAQHIAWVLSGRADITDRVEEVLDTVLAPRATTPGAVR